MAEYVTAGEQQFIPRGPERQLQPLARRAAGIEIEERYCAAAAARVESR